MIITGAAGQIGRPDADLVYCSRDGSGVTVGAHENHRGLGQVGRVDSAMKKPTC